MTFTYINTHYDIEHYPPVSIRSSKQLIQYVLYTTNCAEVGKVGTWANGFATSVSLGLYSRAHIRAHIAKTRPTSRAPARMVNKMASDIYLLGLAGLIQKALSPCF